MTSQMPRWQQAHVEVLRLAQQLRAAATVFRRYAGALKYHPQTGLHGELRPDLDQAETAIRETLAALAPLMARWDEELTWMRSVDPAFPLPEVQQEHAQARETGRLLGAALEIFRRAVRQPESAALDAPYGAGAPRRVHPGAQATWVAERADDLARALFTVTLRKQNLLRMRYNGGDRR